MNASVVNIVWTCVNLMSNSKFIAYYFNILNAPSFVNLHLSHLMTKLTKWWCAQQRLRYSFYSKSEIRSESSLSAQWVAKDPSFLHADSEDSDQAGRMPRLIWDFSLGAQSFCWFWHDVAHLSSLFLNKSKYFRQRYKLEHEKNPTNRHRRQTKTQISLGDWFTSAQADQCLLCALWVVKDSKLLQADSKDSDRTGWMPRSVFAWCTGLFFGLCHAPPQLSLFKSIPEPWVVWYNVCRPEEHSPGPTEWRRG